MRFIAKNRRARSVDPVETRLSETLTRRQFDVPDALQGAVIVGRRSRSSRRLQLTLTAFAVATIALAVGLAGLTHAPRRNSELTTSEEIQTVTLGRVSLDVPSGWTLNAPTCPAELQDSVYVDESILQRACAPALNPKVTIVDIFHLHTNAGAQWLKETSRDERVSGHAARGGSVALTESVNRFVLAIPDVDVVIAIRTSDRSLAERILATAHVVN